MTKESDKNSTRVRVEKNGSIKFPNYDSAKSAATILEKLEAPMHERRRLARVVSVRAWREHESDTWDK